MLRKIPSEAWPGIVLLLSAVTAMTIANSAWAPMQSDFLQSVGTVSFRSLEISMTLINLVIRFAPIAVSCCASEATCCWFRVSMRRA